MVRTGKSKMVGILAFAATATLIVACSGGSNTVETESIPTVRKVEGLNLQTLASQRGDDFSYRQKGDAITIVAPKTNAPVVIGEDGFEDPTVVSVAFWKPGQPMRADVQACAQLVTMTDLSTPTKVAAIAKSRVAGQMPGLALRIRPPRQDGGPARALTVSSDGRNGTTYVFVVRYFTTTVAGDVAAAEVDIRGNADFRSTLGEVRVDPATGAFITTVKPPPWNVCARAIGTTVSIMVWTPHEPKPSWSDTERVKEIKIPRGWVFPGYAGGFIGGLSPGHEGIVRNLTVAAPY